MHQLYPVYISLLLSAIFSGIETAFGASNKLKIEVDKSRNIFSARVLSKFVNNQMLFRSTMWLAKTITLIAYSIFSAHALESYLLKNSMLARFESFTNFIIVILTISVIYYIIAILIPRLLFRFKPNEILSILSLPIYLIYLIFFPFVKFIVIIAEFLLKYILRQQINKHEYLLNTSDLDALLDVTSNDMVQDNEESQEIKMFHNARDLNNIKLREFMVPRNEIVAINKNENLETLGNLIVNSGHSKILVYDESIDNIIGYTHAYDIFAKPISITEIIKPVIIVPGSMQADRLLNTFILERKSVALVVDEFGGTDGMLTIEDILEEIFGDIEDEYDIEEYEDKQLNASEFIVSGRSEIDILNEKYNLNLPESEDYQTVAGLIINSHQSIPVANEEIITGDFTFIILKASETKIEQVLIKVNHS